MSLKEKLDVALTLYAKEATQEFRIALQKIISEYDEKRKAFDFCLDELAMTRNQSVLKDNEISSLNKKLYVQEQGIQEMEALLLANDDHINEYIQERNEKETQLEKQLHTELENRLQLRVTTDILDTYVKMCNTLFSKNYALSKQLLKYEESINKGCCTRMMGIKLKRSMK